MEDYLRRLVGHPGKVRDWETGWGSTPHSSSKIITVSKIMITFDTIKISDIVYYNDINSPQYDCVGKVTKLFTEDEFVAIKWIWATKEFSVPEFLTERLVGRSQFNDWSDHVKFLTEKELMVFLLSN